MRKYKVRLIEPCKAVFNMLVEVVAPSKQEIPEMVKKGEYEIINSELCDGIEVTNDDCNGTFYREALEQIVQLDDIIHIKTYAENILRSGKKFKPIPFIDSIE